MRLFTLHADGQITPGVPADETERRAATLVEIDDEPGTGYRGPFRRDPANPRRAIPHAALLAARARDAARAAAIKAEIEAMAIERLRARGVEGFK